MTAPQCYYLLTMTCPLIKHVYVTHAYLTNKRFSFHMLWIYFVVKDSTVTKFTIHVQSQRSFVFKNSQLFYFVRLCSRQIIVLVFVLLEFAEQSRFLCRVSVDSGSRLLSMVPLSKSFHNVVIFLLQ